MKTVAFLAAAALLAPPAPAHAEPDGLTCEFGGLAAGGGRWIGTLGGGPLTAGSAASVTIRCRIQLGNLHSDPDLASASASGIGAAVLPPAPVDFVIPDDEYSYLYLSTCTELVVDGVTYYWDDAGDSATREYFGRWTTDPSWVNCAPEFDITPDYDPTPVDYALYRLDLLVCPVLAVVFPPEGDTDVWECPPYDWY